MLKISHRKTKYKNFNLSDEAFELFTKIVKESESKRLYKFSGFKYGMRKADKLSVSRAYVKIDFDEVVTKENVHNLYDELTYVFNIRIKSKSNYVNHSAIGSFSRFDGETYIEVDRDFCRMFNLISYEWME